MAAIPISISGVLYDKTARTQQPVFIIGSASIVGLSVGGGPIVPPEDLVPPDPGGGPPGTPTFPIWGPPGIELPPGSGYPPVAGHPLPPIPEQPPELPPGTPPNTVVKAPAEGGWGYITDADGALQAVYNPGAGAAGPKR